MELKYFGLGRGHTNTNVGVEFGQRRMRNSHNPACWFVVRLRDQQHTSLLLVVAAFSPVSVHQCRTQREDADWFCKWMHIFLRGGFTLTEVFRRRIFTLHMCELDLKVHG